MVSELSSQGGVRTCRHTHPDASEGADAVEYRFIIKRVFGTPYRHGNFRIWSEETQQAAAQAAETGDASTMMVWWRWSTMIRGEPPPKISKSSEDLKRKDTDTRNSYILCISSNLLKIISFSEPAHLIFISLGGVSHQEPRKCGERMVSERRDGQEERTPN